MFGSSFARVYPRVCGGALGASASPESSTGLSPRVRGSPRRWQRHHRLRGSIPACAGEPLAGADTSEPYRVYPRVCGGAAAAPSGGSTLAGLSPRVRGSPGRIPVRDFLPRSIPACAGEPQAARWVEAAAQVYPRVCGGAQRVPHLAVAVAGLSPRVRGSPGDEPAAVMLDGSIPACAGEPCLRSRSCRSAGVYPRVCGGARHLVADGQHEQGLSPRVRGSRSEGWWRRRWIRSIPACAGEPHRWSPARPRSRVYPRVCGGARASSPSIPGGGGLSPRVRGSRHLDHAGRQHDGSIPACAGEPCALTPLHAATRVYPRVCGGARWDWAAGAAWRGLSPRVRGSPRALPT